MDRDYNKVAWHILYGVFDEDRRLIYVGSTGVNTIDRLEINHRKWQEKGYSRTNFRAALVESGADWEFKILNIKFCSRADIEADEQTAIQLLHPRMNKDLTPFDTSVERGRIDLT